MTGRAQSAWKLDRNREVMREPVPLTCSTSGSSTPSRRSSHPRPLETSGAERTNLLATDSSSIHRPMSAYETGHHEFVAPGQSAEAIGCSARPREFTAARTSVHRSESKTPAPRASATACCSVAPRPTLPGIWEKKRMRRLAGLPGNEQSSVLIMMMRSTPAASMDSLTVAMFEESRVERSRVVVVTPRAVSTASVPENASVSAARSARDSTTTTRERAGTSAMRSGRERTMAVKSIPFARHTPRMPRPRPPAAPRTATQPGSILGGKAVLVGFIERSYAKGSGL